MGRRIWDVATGNPVGVPLEHKGQVFQIVYSPDGRMLATACQDRTARIWDAATGAALFPPIVHETEVSSVAFHPDGRVLLTACSDNSLAERAAQQWEIATGKPIGPPLKHGDGVLWATYSPDGTRVATASEDMSARIWDTATGAPVTRPLRHRHWIGSVEFSPDGRHLATCSGDGTARVWDVATGEPLSAPFLHQDQKTVSSVKFRGDGRAILTAGQDGTVRCWELSLDDRSVDALITEAQVRAGRRIDQTGGQVPLSATELSTAWAQLRREETARRESRPAPSLVEWHRREARRLWAGRQGAAAAWHLDRLVQFEPGDSSLAVRLAAAYVSVNAWANVERAASQAIKSGSGDLDNLAQRAWARVYLGRPQEAGADFRQAIEREPDSATLRIGLFLTLAERGAFGEANAIWRLVVDDQDERFTDVWSTLAAHLDRLTESHPKSWWLWRARGHVRVRAGSPDQAEADYNKAIEIRSDDAWSWLGRGLARKHRGQKESALADLSKSVDLDPKISAAWAIRGELLGGLTRWDEAAESYDRWSVLGGNALAIPWYFHTLLRLYVGDQPGYRRACESMIERFGTTADGFTATLVAHGCSLGSDPGVSRDRVVDLAKRGARANPRSGLSLYTHGAALRRAGRLDEAMAAFDQAARVDPGWNGTPLIAAQRALTERALLSRPERDRGFLQRSLMGTPQI